MFTQWHNAQNVWATLVSNEFLAQKWVEFVYSLSLWRLFHCFLILISHSNVFFMCKNPHTKSPHKCNKNENDSSKNVNEKSLIGQFLPLSGVETGSITEILKRTYALCLLLFGFFMEQQHISFSCTESVLCISSNCFMCTISINVVSIGITNTFTYLSSYLSVWLSFFPLLTVDDKIHFTSSFESCFLLFGLFGNGKSSIQRAKWKCIHSWCKIVLYQAETIQTLNQFSAHSLFSRSAVYVHGSVYLSLSFTSFNLFVSLLLLLHLFGLIWRKY